MSDKELSTEPVANVPGIGNIYDNSGVNFVRFACRSLFGTERRPANRGEWDLVMNYLALNAETPREETLEFLGWVNKAYLLGYREEFLEKLVDHQRAERVRRGVPLPEETWGKNRD